MPHLPHLSATPPGPPASSRAPGSAGSITVEAIFGLFTILALTSLAVVGWSVGMDALKKRAVAQQLQQVGQAATVYARATGLLTNTALSADVKMVTIQDLMDAGVLPATSDGSLKNAWGQEYLVYYYAPAPVSATAPRRLISVVLTSGGEAMDELALSAAAMAGAGGGLVLNKAAPGATVDDWVLRGVGNSYELPLNATAYPVIPSPGQGHIGLYVSLDDAALGTGALYREPVPGHPELNQMHIDLDMSRNSLREVKELQFSDYEAARVDLTTVCKPSDDGKTAEGKVFFYAGETDADKTIRNGLYACRGGKPYQIGDAGNSSLLRSVKTADPGETIAKPICPPGLSPFISVSPADIPITAGTTGTIRTFFESSDDSSPWTVHMQMVGTGTELADGKISVITSCAPTT